MNVFEALMSAVEIVMAPYHIIVHVAMRSRVCNARATSIHSVMHAVMVQPIEEVASRSGYCFPAHLEIPDALTCETTEVNISRVKAIKGVCGEHGRSCTNNGRHIKVCVLDRLLLALPMLAREQLLVVFLTFCPGIFCTVPKYVALIT